MLIPAMIPMAKGKLRRSLTEKDKKTIRWCLYIFLFMLIILIIALYTIGSMVMGYEVAEIFAD